MVYGLDVSIFFFSRFRFQIVTFVLLSVVVEYST